MIDPQYHVITRQFRGTIWFNYVDEIIGLEPFRFSYYVLISGTLASPVMIPRGKSKLYALGPGTAF